MLRSLLLLFSSLPLSLSLSRDQYVGSPLCLQGCLSDTYPYVGSPLSVSPSVFRDLLLRSLLFPFFSLPLSLSFETSLCRLSTLCLPICLQRPVAQISALALFFSFPSLSFEGSLCRFSTVCRPVCLQRPVTQISALPLFLSSSPF